MKREPSLATLKALAEADDALSTAVNVGVPDVYPLIEAQHAALAAYRAEIAPRLRTRAEVDAEIVATVRNSITRGLGVACSTVDALASLCAEPTAPEGEKPPTGKECDWCQDSSRPPLHRNHAPAKDEWVCRRCLDEVSRQ